MAKEHNFQIHKELATKARDAVSAFNALLNTRSLASIFLLTLFKV